MRSSEEINKSIPDLILLHGERSEVLAKTRSILGVAFIEEESFDAALEELQTTLTICDEIGLEKSELFIDTKYRYGKALEASAVNNEQVEEANNFLLATYEMRENFDKENPNINYETPGSIDEEFDSTLLYFDFALDRHRNGDNSTALSMLKKCISLRKKKFGETSPALAQSMLGYADLLRELGQYDEAKKTLNDALQYVVKVYGRNNLKVAEILNSLGNIYRINLDFEASEVSLKESLAIRSELLGDADIQVGASLNNMAEVYREKCDYPKAIEYHKKAITVFEQSVGADHPGTINAKGNYAITLQRLSDSCATEASSYLNQAIEFMHNNNYEGNHPWLMKFGNEHILEAAHNFAKAELYERSIDLYETLIARKQSVSQSIGKNSSNESGSSQLISALDNKAIRIYEMEKFELMINWIHSLIEKSKFSAAFELLAKSQKYSTVIFKDVPTDLNEFKLFANLKIAESILTYIKGDIINAMESAKELISLIDEKVDKFDSVRIRPLLFLAQSYGDLGQYKDAETYTSLMLNLLQRKFEKDNTAFGKASVETIIVLIKSLLITTKLRISKGMYDSALTFLDRINEFIVQNVLEENEVYADYLVCKAEINLIKGSHTVVLSNLELALQIENNNFGKSHVKYLSVLGKVSMQYSKQGFFTKALNSIEEALFHAAEAIQGINPRHHLLAELYTAKAQILCDIGNYIESKTWLNKSIDLYTQCNMNTSSPAMIQIYQILAMIQIESYEFKPSRQSIELLHQLLIMLYGENNIQQYYQAYMQYLEAYAYFKQGRFKQTMSIITPALNNCIQSTIHIHHEGSIYLEILLELLKFRIILIEEKLNDAKTLISKIGTNILKYYQKHEALLLYQGLKYMAEVNILAGKYRDAKVQLSFAYGQTCLILGSKFNAHRVLIDIMIAAIENMRSIGYFSDAMDAYEILEGKVLKKYGEESKEMFFVDFLYAKLCRDRRKFPKSETLFSDMEKKIVDWFGHHNFYYMNWKVEFGRSFLAQNKISLADALLKEAYEIGDQLFSETLIPYLLNIKSDMAYLNLTGKPIDVEHAIKAIKEQILPACSDILGSNHMYCIHLKGRISMLMNSFKKDSGRKLLFETLKSFDELKPFPLPYDHPYVMELGGYEKASSKERLSQNIREVTFYPWATNIEIDSDPNGSFLPKSLFVDVKNFDPECWALVHYYGTELFTQSNMFQSTKQRGRGASRGGDRSRSPSPSNTAKSASNTSNGPVVDENTLELLKIETIARKEAEDLIVILKHEKENLKESLENETTAKVSAEKHWAEEKARNTELEGKFNLVNKELEDLKAKLLAIETELNLRIEKEAEEARIKAIEEEKLAEEAKRRQEAELNGEVPPETNPKFQFDLQASDFLYKRAQSFYDLGHFTKASSLYEECCNIRQKILTMNHRLSLQSFLSQAINLRSMNKFSQAEEIFSQCLIAADKYYNGNKIHEFYVLIQLEAYINRYEQGLIEAVVEDVDTFTNTLNLKIQNHDTSDNPVIRASLEEYQILCGRATSLQAQLYMEIGKFNESKVLFEKSNALLTKAFGQNHFLVIDNNLAKSRLMLILAKPKEVLVTLDQAMPIIKAIIKSNLVLLASNEVSEEMKAFYLAQSETSGELVHPKLLTCYILYLRALCIQCKYNEAKRKLTQAQELYRKLFGSEIIYEEVAPVSNYMYKADISFYESLLLFYNCHYFNAKDILTTVFTQLKSGLIANLPELIAVNHPVFAMYHHLFGMIDFKLGKYTKSKESFNQCILQLKPYPQNILVYESKIFLISIMQQLGQYSLTKIYLDDAKDKLRAVISNKEHPLHLNLEILLSQYYLSQENYENAEKVLIKALERIRIYFNNEGHILMMDILLNLIQVKLQEKNLADSKKYYQEAKDLCYELFKIVIEHEYFAILTAFEANIMLLEMIEEENKPPEDPNAKKEDEKKISDEKKAESNQGEEEAKDNSPENLNQTEETQPSDVQEQMIVMVGDEDILIPTFKNEKYLVILDKYQTAIDRFDQIYGFDNHSFINKNDSSVFASPFVMYIQGKVGQVQLMEYIALQSFIQQLSAKQREAYHLLEEEKAKSLSSELKRSSIQAPQSLPAPSSISGQDAASIVVNPPGKLTIEKSIQTLRKNIIPETVDDIVAAGIDPLKISVNSTTFFIHDLESILEDLQLQFDDMQIALHHLQKANNCKELGQFKFADQFYDESFLRLFSFMGAKQCSESKLIATLLYEKAINASYMAKKIDYIKSLHLLAMKIYRQYQFNQVASPNNNSFTLKSSDVVKNDDDDKSVSEEESKPVESEISEAVDDSDSQPSMELVNDEFMIKNYLALTNLLLDQKLYDDALSSHLQIEQMIQKYSSSLANARNSKIKNGNISTDERLVFLLLLAEIKILIGRDYISLYRYGDGIQYTQDAWQLLQSIANIEGTSTRFIDLTVRAKLNFILINNYLGKFMLVDEFFNQINNIFAGILPPHLSLFSGSTLDLVETLPTPLKILVSLIYQVQAEFFYITNKNMESKSLILKSLEIRKKYFNFFEVPSIIKSKANSKEPIRWSKDKEEEMKILFFNAVDTLLQSESGDPLSNNKKINPSLPSSNNKKDVSRRKTQDEVEDEEDARLEDEISASKAEDEGPEKSGNQISGSINVTSEAFFPSNETIPLFTFEEQKYTPHSCFIDIFFLLSKISLNLGLYSTAKDGFETCSQMMIQLYSKSISLFKLQLQFYLIHIKFYTTKGTQNSQQVSIIIEIKEMHEKLLEHRLSLLPSSISEISLDLSESLLALSKLSILLGQYDDSMQYINEALKIERACYNRYNNHPAVSQINSSAHNSRPASANGTVRFSSTVPSTPAASVKIDLHYRIQAVFVLCAEILYYKGFFHDSIALCNTTLGSLKHVYGTDLHVQVASLLILLGRNETELGKFDSAITYFQQAKSIHVVISGEKHYEVGMILTFMSQVLRYKGKLLESKQHLDLAIQYIRSNLHKHHLYTLYTLLEIGYNFQDLGKFNTAEHILLRAVSLLRKLLGADHIWIGQAKNAFGELYLKMGYLEKVLECYDSSLYILRKNIGSDRYPLIAVVLANIAELKAVKGINDLAVQGLDDALALMKLIFNTPNHFLIAKYSLLLSNIYIQQGKIYEAKSQFEKIFYMLKTLYVSEHPYMYDAQLGIAQCFKLLGKIDQAKALIERCLSNMKDWKGSNHPTIGFILNRLGDIYNILSQFKMAESVLKEAYGIRMKYYRECNENHPEIVDNLVSLAENCRLRGIYQYNKSSKKRSSSKVVSSTKKKKDEILTDAKGENVDVDDDTLGDEILGEYKKPDNIPKEPVAQGPKLDDEMSAPTVMISEIENLDKDYAQKDDSSLLAPSFDPNSLFSDPEAYNASALLEKASSHFTIFILGDTAHPFMLFIKYLMAEVFRGLGNYEKSLALHEVLLLQRKKILGDRHIETIESLVAMGELLRVMKRVFPSNGPKPGNQHSLAQDQTMPGGNMAGTTTLLDQLTSLTLPVPVPGSKAKLTSPLVGNMELDEEDSVGGSKSKKRPSSGKWVFLTKIEDNEAKKKKKPLPIPRGYMGYAFPPAKKEQRPITAESIISGQDSNSKSSNPLHDPKKLFDLSISLQRKLFQPDETDFKKAEPFDHPLMAQCVYNKAEILRIRGDGMGSLRLLEQALAMRRRIFRAHHPVVAECLFSMAELLRSDQRFAQARPIFDKALEIREEVYGNEHPLIAEILNSIALLCIAQGDFDQAQELVENSIKICEAFLGENHPATALAYNNQAGLLQSLGKYKEALIWCKKALQIKEKLFGDQHPEVASTLNNLGLLLKSQNKYDQSIAYFQHALDIQKNVLGMNHPDVGSTLSNIASVFALQDGKRFEAKDTFRQALAIRTSCFGNDNALVASTMNNYAGLLYSIGDYEPAKEMFEQSLQIRRKVLGEDHPAVAESLHNLGYWYYSQNQLLDAKYKYEEALKIREKVFGDDHYLVSTTALHLSGVCDQLDELDKALQCAQLAYKIREKRFGDLNPDVIAAKKSLQIIEQRIQDRLLREEEAARAPKSRSKSAASFQSYRFDVSGEADPLR